MLPYQIIKDDIKNGYVYMEYDGKWCGYEYLISYSVTFDNVAVEFWKDNHVAFCKFYLDEFLNDVMESYKNYTKVMNEVIYYNLVPMDE